MWVFRERSTCAPSVTEGSYARVCGRAVVCDAYQPPPRSARYCVYMHIYRGKPPDSPLYSNSAAFSDIPAETLDRKAPAFESTRSSRPCPSSQPPCPRVAVLSPFSPRPPPRAHSRRLSYATSSRHIRTKSNVSRLNGFVSSVRDHLPLARPPPPPSP